MRILMYILLGLAAVFIGLQTYTTISTKGTPQQQYTVIRTIGELEVRRYPEALSATVLQAGSTYKEVSSGGFRKLAGYIFGGNGEEQKIAMTAPVHMEMGADSSRMRFVMPDGLDWNNMPAPDDPNVKLERLPEEVVAVLRFGGFANDEVIAQWSARLLDELSKAGLEASGPLRFLGYDPPWQLVMRRNEVVIAVKWTRP